MQLQGVWRGNFHLRSRKFGRRQGRRLAALPLRFSLCATAPTKGERVVDPIALLVVLALSFAAGACAGYGLRGLQSRKGPSLS